MSDLLVKLYDISTDTGEKPLFEKYGIIVKRAIIIDKDVILDFVRSSFDSETWASECEYALFNNPTSCYIAVRDKEIIGFGCYDATAKGFFGPFGVRENERNKGVGKVIFKKCMNSMKEMGYGYAIIGWTSAKAISFYKREGNAVVIEDSPPQKSVYKNMIKTE